MAEILPISVCIIAGNEAQRIRRTLDSVRGWTREIVLAVDDQVTDGTDKIGAEYGARVICQPWHGHTEHRNFASAHATQPWLLALDADEVISDELRAEIIAAFKNPAPPPAAYSFPRLSFFCGRWIHHGDWYPDRKVRLWQRGQARWEGDNVHEKLVVAGTSTRLNGNLLHYSMDGLDHFTRKSIMVSNLFLRQKAGDTRPARRLDLWLRPGWRFVRGYFLKRGFLDGWQGYAIARMVAFETFLRYAKFYERSAAPDKAQDHPDS